MSPLVLLLATALAQGSAPVGDDEAALVYMQSRFLPSTFDICAKAYPKAADDYAAALAAWNRTNAATVARGEAYARQRVKQEGQDLDTALATEHARLRSEIDQLPEAERAGMCSRLLESTRNES